MARIVTDSHHDFVRIYLFIPAVDLLGIQGQIFIKKTTLMIMIAISNRLWGPLELDCPVLCVILYSIVSQAS
jgi:hypothetical protein